MSSVRLSIRAAGKRFGSLVAVEDCSIDIRSGEFCAIVGPSGCGKSTLLNAVAGFDSLSNGEIRLDGRLINAPGHKLNPGPDRIVVFQNDALFPWSTVQENLVRGPVLRGIASEQEIWRRAQVLLAQVGLVGIGSQYPGSLSSGMSRRVEIVRALLHEPQILLLDEPFRGMDALTKMATHDALLALHVATAGTILFITHDLEEAIYLADRVLVMSSRPGRFRQVVDVDLPRPRERSMLTSGNFVALHHLAVEALREEAIKAFVSGERELA